MLLIARLLGIALALLSPAAPAETVAEIQAKSQQALAHLQQQAGVSRQLLTDAAGVLVFPDIVKVGFGAGGQYGEGVLLIDGQPDGYYATAGASFGLQLGVEFKSEIIVFLSERSLQAFRRQRGFKVGVDANVSIITPGSLGELASGATGEEIVAFVLTNEGLMANLSLAGATITRLAR
ncbi:hypothetical protein DWB85_08510 [Seongchinamella sediminis]|uniref:Ysc84 actin-binding domain-containing protein n=1 Tax=Seongchinamella sediminis TaxID=2283635 RepID=A0A3L7E2A9_9GAMM|nr:YSC84-related protein [Seongchinamella sediminis]RLQ22312.1 hypothetical protein DWB85_08510 [Seongchinamella sediminis]